MNLSIEFIKFFILVILIVIISKYLLIKLLRELSKSLNLSAKMTGNITGVATSVPELLTVCFSAYGGLIDTSAFNILTSNIINTIQYFITILLNKNIKVLNKKYIRLDLLLVAFTIVLPIIILLSGQENNKLLIIIFPILFIIFSKISKKNHKINKKKENIKKEDDITNINRAVLIVLGLIAVVILLFLVGNMLSETLENLCIKFNIPQILIGIILGIMTSTPELITFFESQKHHHKQMNKEKGVIEATSNLLTSNMMNLFIVQTIGIIIYLVFNKL